jgi:3-oxoacyl-[acyl-carrier-protein] synthase II
MTSGVGTDAPTVEVIGVGVVTPVGCTVNSLWSALCAGRTGATVFHDDRLPTGVRALVSPVVGFDDTMVSAVERRRLDRSHVLAIAAATQALAMAGTLPPPDRRAVVCGVALGPASTYEEQLTRLVGGGLRALSPLTAPLVMPSSVAAQLSLRFGFAGPCVTTSSACASGAAAIAEGVELLRRGAADVVLAGGVDSMVGYGAMCAFLRLDAMSRQVENPEHASRPFDADRDGFVMAEGAGFLVLRRAPACSAERGVGPPSLGVLAGHASTCDAHHLVAPPPDGEGAARCMRLALHDAGISAADVRHINAHGTGTVANDLAEAAAIAAVFGESPPPVTAVKGATGHMMGGSGAVEAIVALESARRGVVPAVAGLHRLDPGIALDVVRCTPRRVRPGPAISNAFGFGGANTTLVLTPPQRHQPAGC